jgi:hypothetical protein
MLHLPREERAARDVTWTPLYSSGGFSWWWIDKYVYLCWYLTCAVNNFINSIFIAVAILLITNYWSLDFVARMKTTGPKLVILHVGTCTIFHLKDSPSIHASFFGRMVGLHVLGNRPVRVVLTTLIHHRRNALLSTAKCKKTRDTWSSCSSSGEIE